MSWKKTTLGEVVRLRRGHDLPSRSRVAGDIPIVSSSGITGYHNVSKANGPGVVTGRYGTLGEVYYIEGAYWPLNTALYVEDFKGNHPRFVAYLISTLGLGERNSAGAVPGVNRNALHPLTVLVPSIDEQVRVADCLARYDDLMAINRRRIALLEEAARNLYREWFVKLRFPGHESVRIKDGVPIGWSLQPLGTVAPLHYGKALKAAAREIGEIPVYGSSGVIGFHNHQLVEAGAIIVGRKGNLGSLYYSAKPSYPIDTVFFIEPNKASIRLFLAMHDLHFINSDAAVPGLNRTYAQSLPVMVPEAGLAKEFEIMITPFFNQAELLREQNTRIAEARDLLLPKLMSGKIKV
ncbi:MAG: restriction endonuclease subunit S [Fluviibacter sp.]